MYATTASYAAEGVDSFGKWGHEQAAIIYDGEAALLGGPRCSLRNPTQGYRPEAEPEPLRVFGCIDSRGFAQVSVRRRRAARSRSAAGGLRM